MKKLRLIICMLLVFSLTACGTFDSKPVVSDEKADTEQAANVEQKVETDSDVQLDFTYAGLKGTEFWFGSGAGAWSTTLTVAEDGSFKGQYHDSDMGDTGEGYPNGTQYFCAFTGKFKKLTKVDDLTYTTAIESISYGNKVGTEEIIDGIRYIYTEAYGLDDAKTIYFYLKGTKVSGLSEGLASWIQSALFDYETEQTAAELPFIAMYNENADRGFSSYNMAEDILDNLDFYEALDLDYLKCLQTDGTLTQADMNDIAYRRYYMWDGYLNDIWRVLLEIKPDEEMAAIKAEQIAWIKEKEAAAKEAGSEANGGSLQPLLEYGKAAEMTKERVYELVELLK